MRGVDGSAYSRNKPSHLTQKPHRVLNVGCCGFWQDAGVDNHFAHFVVIGGDDHGGFVAGGLKLCQLGVGEQNDFVPHFGEVGGGAVDADFAFARFAKNDVGFKSGTVVEIEHNHGLIGLHAAGAKEVGVDGDRADVIEVAAGDRGAVDFRLEEFA